MDSPIVDTDGGRVRGTLRTTLDGDPIFTFLGIPYAKPPLGDLRFKAPQPPEPWTGIRDATKEGDHCYLDFEGMIGGSEDCLKLDVFTRELPHQNTQLKPVMFFIHGGAFIFGSNALEITGPEFLLTEDIVLVTINYRIGFLGFLSMEDHSLGVTGNAGLKDQTMAMKWVQKNIRRFGGDPNNVTIWGESAGAASVHLHVFSQLSKGLFHKAVLLSGSALSEWCFTDGQHGVALVRSMGKEVNTEREALDILRSLSKEDLARYQAKYTHGKLSVVAPVIEKPHDSAFITKHPMELLTSGNYNRVPIMLGYCSNEGLIFEQFSLCSWSSKLLNGDFSVLENFIPREMKIEKGSPTSQAICKKLKEFYFEGEYAGNKHVFISDFYFLYGMLASAKWHAKTSQNPVYIFRFSLNAGLNWRKKKCKWDKYPGASHSDELGYLFKITDETCYEMGDLEETSIRRIVELLTNFAKYGNPTPDGKDLNIKWEPVEENNVHILDIDEELTVHVNPEPERLNVWREIFQLSPFTRHYL
ncbi:hypothetical protein JTB14_015147 [Gonioctena quinquepunctata]|nr:hypothetical protein JTB14_015147 [Gonioctena quinquepunctata]